MIPEVVRPLPEQADRRRARVGHAGRVPRLRDRRSSATRARSATTAPTPRARRGSARSSATSSAAMDIEGAGWKTLEQLLQTGLVTKRGDFFRLPVEDLEGLERFGRKSAENLHANIQKAKRRPLERIIASLGHPPGRLDDGDRAGPLAGGRGAGGAGEPDWLVARRPRTCRRSRATRPSGSRRSRASARRSSAALAAWFAPGGPGEGVLEDLADAGVVAELPGAAGQGGGRARSPARRSSSPARSRASAARRRRRRSARRAASRRARCRRRPTTSSPARARARSWRRPRSWACRSSTVMASPGCSRASRRSKVRP